MDWLPLAAGGAGVAALLPLQYLNSRRTWAPIEVRAVADTTLHGVVPAAACAPLWWGAGSPDLRLALLAFLCGFLLDMDHLIAFRSLSLKKCSTQERRPFGHGLAAVAVGGAAAGAIAGSWLWGALAGFALASHVLFDATDASGVPLLWPHRWIVRRVPCGVYGLFVFAGLVLSALATRPLRLPG
jgi:membrane-bound metal-dependent hydrolase YbcI (DUF457 family)